MSAYPSHPFDVPLAIGDVDCIASVRITSYIKGAAPYYDPDCGPGWPEELEWTIDSVRLDAERPTPYAWPGDLDALLSSSDLIRQACLDEIKAANERP